MKLTWNLCYSNSHGGDELLDEEFILVFFLLLHLCIMCMWYKRDLNTFFVSFFVPRGACKLYGWCMPESLWLWWLSIHNDPSDVSQRMCVSWSCCLNKTSWRHFFPLLFMKGMPIFLPILFVESEILWNDFYASWLNNHIHSLGNKQRQILVNSSQIKKKDMPRWAVISSTTVKHNEHADQK